MIERTAILLSLQSALLGEIKQNVRAVVFKYNPSQRCFLLRYYLDSSPTTDDYESVECAITEFISDFKFDEFDRTKAECIYSKEPIGKLDILDGVVFSRKEY